MKKAKCLLDKDYTIGDIDSKLYGSFLEHLGRAIYSGIYEPGHAAADEQGFRQDVLALVQELAVPVVRYPGGNFVSGYRWTDGIGPRSERPRRLDYAWHTIEPNQIGIDEFVDWCRKAHTDVMAAVNLGTGTPQDAGDMIEYCNYPAGTYWSDLRIKNGHREPHKIKLWCLGNEMDGPWQTGALSAADYGKKARETAKIMRCVDADIELVACGSASPFLPTYPEWDRVVLEHTYDQVDYISMHRYYENEGNVADFLASFVDMDDFIKTIAATADYVKAKQRSSKVMKISFDEWNVWYQKKQTREPWMEAPPILEDHYSLLDALVFGGMLCTLLNHSDRVKMACLAQLVNVIAPIFTERGGRVLKQSIFYPFQQVSLYGRGKAMRVLTKTDLLASEHYGEVPALQTAAAYDEAAGMVTVFVLNCTQQEALDFTLDLRSFGSVQMVEHQVMQGDDIYAQNTFAEPDRVVPYKKGLTTAETDGAYHWQLEPLSWHVLRFAVE